MEILKEYLGLIQIPAWRLQPTDPQYLYTVTAALSAPDLPLVSIIITHNGYHELYFGESSFLQWFFIVAL